MGNGLRRSTAATHTRGLTHSERKVVRDTWSAFCRARPDFGVLIFVEFFQRHPSLLQVFPLFGDQQLKDLVSTPRFKAHGCAVGTQITAVVDSLDDPVVLVELIRKNAARHAIKPGVRVQHFDYLLQAVLVAMQTRCSGLTPDTTAARAKLFALVMEVTRQEFDVAAAPEQAYSPRAQLGAGGSSGSTSPLCTASSFRQPSSLFTMAPSDVSLPIVPPVARPRSSRRILRAPESSSIDSSADVCATGPPQ